MAFNLPHAVVDGNVYRVLSRHYDIGTPINSTEGKHEFSMLAQQLLPPDEAAAFNQAIMDFGATQCTPQSPRCMACPLQESCVALREGRIDELPVKKKTLKVKERHLDYIYIRYRSAEEWQQHRCGLTAIRRRGEGDIWQGLWEPVDMKDLPDTKGLQLVRKDFRHVLTHRILLCDFYLLETERQPVLPDGYVWVSEDELADYALPRMFELLFKSLPEPK